MLLVPELVPFLKAYPAFLPGPVPAVCGKESTTHFLAIMVDPKLYMIHGSPLIQLINLCTTSCLKFTFHNQPTTAPPHP